MNTLTVRYCTLLIAFAIWALGAISMPGARADAVADHFRGKTIRLIWPGAPGGDRGLYAYPFMKHFGRHLPGNPKIIPAFMPGAGGAIAVNYLYSVAAPDGLTIATPLAPVVIAQATGSRSVKYDVSRMNWIGRIADATRILFVNATSGLQHFEDLKLRDVIVGSTGRASETFINPAVMNQMLGTRFRIVTGYKAQPEVNLAPQRGETDGAFSTWNNISNIQGEELKRGIIRIILQIAPKRHPDLSTIPVLAELASTNDARAVIEFMTSSAQMGQSYVAPPGTPAPLLAALRQAFDDTMRDPAFIAELHQGKIELNPASGAELNAIVARTIATPQTTVARYQAAIAAE